MCTGFNWLCQGAVTSCCKHSGSIKSSEYLDQLNEYETSKEDRYNGITKC